ncbi:MAG: hypothetical protein ACRBN8_38125 [Nannocystales bacterium]
MSERVHVNGKSIELRPEHFVAAGGQGRVFALGDVAFKLFSDPAAALPPDKLRALNALKGPHVAAPVHTITDGRGSSVGYTMPFFRGAHSWAQLCTPVYRRRVGLDDRAAMGLVRSLGAALAQIHRQGATVVDLSENNVLVRDTAVCLIDLDSWQTRDHPATAVTPAILSPHAPPGHFDTNTDWFSFAVLACTLLLGIHPFKGKHPNVRGIAARMQAGLSVFDASVRTPSVCKRPETLPATLRAWLELALHRGGSAPPPLGPLPSPADVSGSRPTDAVRYPAPIRWVVVGPQRVHVATSTAAFDDSQCWHDDGQVLRALGRARTGQPFVLQCSSDGGTELRMQGCDARVPLTAAYDEILSHRGRVFARVGGRLVELEAQRIGDRPILLTREVARVLPLATRLFPGVAVQNALGSWRASLLGHPSGAPQVPLPALDACEVLDARRAGTRLMVLCQREGVVSRHSFVLSPDGAVSEHAVQRNADPWDTTFVAIGDLYVEVGETGLVQRSGDQVQPWQAPGGNRQDLDLHSDGQRVFASSGRDLQELRAPPPQVYGSQTLGFDATRCR